MLLDQLIPARSITYRGRPSDPWFDDECRAAKRSTRQLERAVHRAATCDAPVAIAVCTVNTIYLNQIFETYYILLS